MGTPRHDHERILELHRKGLDTAAIAARVGCSTRVVRYVLKRKGDGHEHQQG